MSQPAPTPTRTGFDFVHAIVHGVQMFAAVATATLLANIPSSDTKALVLSAIVAGIRAVFAGAHH